MTTEGARALTSGTTDQAPVRFLFGIDLGDRHSHL